MLIDDRLLALNDLVQAGKHAAEQYADAAEALDPDPTAARFRAAAEEHRRAVAALEEAIRSGGELPHDSNADRDALERWVARVKAKLADDEVEAYRAEAHETESEILRRAETALGHDLRPSVRAAVEEMRRRARATLRELGAG